MKALGIFVKQKTCWWFHQHVPAEKVSFFHLTLIMPTTPIAPTLMTVSKILGVPFFFFLLF